MSGKGNSFWFLNEIDTHKPTELKLWLLFFLLAVFIHFLVLHLPLTLPTPTHSPPVEVQTISPEKLESIRRKWREQSLLLDQKKSPSEKKSKSSTEPPPKDARYFSNRNIRVEKEQRARDTAVIPNLKNLGVPFQLNPSLKNSSSSQRNPASQIPIQDHSQKQTQAGAETRQFQPPNPATANQANRANQADSGDQAIQDRDLPLGSENLLNAQESVYYSFYARMYETIGPIWNSLIHHAVSQRSALPPRSGEPSGTRAGEYTTVLDVTLDHSGNLKDIRIVSSSGVSEYDQAAILSWKQAGKFPNPPRGLLDSQGEIHTGWTYRLEIGQGFHLNTPPPRRNY